jgi:hypothetical protein
LKSQKPCGRFSVLCAKRLVWWMVVVSTAKYTGHWCRLWCKPIMYYIVCLHLALVSRLFMHADRRGILQFWKMSADALSPRTPRIHTHPSHSDRQWHCRIFKRRSFLFHPNENMCSGLWIVVSNLWQWSHTGFLWS